MLKLDGSMCCVVCAFIALCLVGCQPDEAVKLVYPDKIVQNTQWSEQDMQKDIAVQPLYRNAHTSTHLIRLKGKEFPHFHDHHDLTVSMLSGNSTLHFEHHAVLLAPGDVVFIPKGTFHWAENTHPVASVVFAVFSPAFSGKDRRRADN